MARLNWAVRLIDDPSPCHAWFCTGLWSITWLKVLPPDSQKLELVGVGFKAATRVISWTWPPRLFAQHHFEIPKELKVTTSQEKGQNPTITLEGVDKQLLGQVCAKIRSLRKPEPYKGKGVKFEGEVLGEKQVKRRVNNCKIIFLAVSEIKYHNHEQLLS